MSFFPRSPVCLSSHISNNTLKDSIFSEKEEGSDSANHETGSAEKRPLIDDVEVLPVFSSVTGPLQSQSSTLEYSIPAKRKLVYLAGYFLLNLSLTIYNKAVLGAVSLALFLLLEDSMLTASIHSSAFLGYSLHCTLPALPWAASSCTRKVSSD